MKRLLITSGRGPAECRIALAKLLERIRHDARERGLDVDLVEGHHLDKHGPASVIAVLYGNGVEPFAREWVGSIQWIAPSPIRPNHKRKNWFVGVFELPEAAETSSEFCAGDVRFETFRAGGPGGQHQNTTESAVRATHMPTGLSVVARDERSQHRNKALALRRLAEVLRLREDLAAIADRQQAQEQHDRLQRGQPVKRFKGAEFSAME